MMSDYEIEYLEEDAEILQPYLHEAEPLPALSMTKSVTKSMSKSMTESTRSWNRQLANSEQLLVEKVKKKSSAAKRRLERFSSENGNTANADDDDTDYDPNFENVQKRPRRSKRIHGNNSIHEPAKKILKISHHEQNTPIRKDKTPETKMAIEKIRSLSGISLKNNSQKKSSRVKSQSEVKSQNSEAALNKNTSQKRKLMIKKNRIRPEAASKKVLSENVIKQKESILDCVRKDPMRKLHDMRFSDTKDEDYFEDIIPDNNKQRISKWNNACKIFSHSIQGNNTKTCKTVQYLRKIQGVADGKITNLIRLYHEAKEDNDYSSFEAVLPHLEAKNPMKIVFEQVKNVRKYYNSETTTILTKENGTDGPILVAFSPTELRVTTFELTNDGGDLRMLMTCQMCAKCYQYSWRGSRDLKPWCDVRCAACTSEFPSAYNLLAHLRTHRLSAHHKRQQNQLLAQMMPYHYNCRVCHLQLESIPALRRHLRLHRSKEKFFCEVGRHITV